MNKPILYSFRRCPYAMRARLAIVLSQQQVRLREVVLKDKPQALLDVSPKATVPVMVLGETLLSDMASGESSDKQVIDESLDIMTWCIEQLNNSELNQINTELDKELLAYNDGAFKAQLDQYKYFERYPENTQEAYRDSAMAYLHRLNTILEKQAFLSGDKLGFMDIGILPFIRQFAFVDKNWFDAEAPSAVVQWLNDFLASDLFKRIMDKYPQWQGDNEIIFPPLN